MSDRDDDRINEWSGHPRPTRIEVILIVLVVLGIMSFFVRR